MKVELITHQSVDVFMVCPVGTLTLGDATSALREIVWDLVEGGARLILLNMAAVSHIDSSALGELVAAYTTIVTAGGQMKLLKLAGPAHQLLQLTRLYTVFEVFEDETEAVRSFSLA